MQEHKIIVIGASSGGVEALKELFRGLESDFNAAIFVVLHLPPQADSHLPYILSRQGPVPVEHAKDGQAMKTGHAYIAPPGRHLILQDGFMRLTFGPSVNYTRPAIDPLFESAAQNYGSRVIGIILSGALYDGAKGLLSIKQAGGVAIVQDPKEALFSEMPDTALQNVQVDFMLPVAEIAARLNQLVDKAVLKKGETMENQSVPDFSEDETNLIKTDMEKFEKGDSTTPRSVLTCPECGGVLWEIRDGKLIRYRCHTGHIFNAEKLLTSHDAELEKAFWTTIRLLVEKAAISNRLALRAKDSNNKVLEDYYLSMAKEAENEADQIRESWSHGKALGSRKESAGERANDDVTQSAE